MFSHFLILNFLVLFRIILSYQNYTNTYSSYIEDQIDEAIKFVIVKNEIYCFGETYSYLIKQFKNEALTKLYENKMKIKSYSSNILNINDEYFGVGAVDGKVKRYQNKTPISYILSPANGSTPGGGSGPGSNGGVTPGEAGNGDDEGE